MGKSARMAKANPNKPGDFFYKAGDGAPVSDIAGKPTIWMDPDPMVDCEYTLLLLPRHLLSPIHAYSSSSKPAFCAHFWLAD